MNFQDLKDHTLSAIFTGAAAFTGAAVLAAVPTLVYGTAQAIGLGTGLSFVAAGASAVVWAGSIIGAGVIFGAGAALLGAGIAAAAGMQDYKLSSGAIAGLGGFVFGLSTMFGLAANDDTSIQDVQDKLEEKVSMIETYEAPQNEDQIAYYIPESSNQANLPKLAA